MHVSKFDSFDNQGITQKLTRPLRGLLGGRDITALKDGTRVQGLKIYNVVQRILAAIVLVFSGIGLLYTIPAAIVLLATPKPKQIDLNSSSSPTSPAAPVISGTSVANVTSQATSANIVEAQRTSSKTSHVFQEGQIENGKIYYQGDVPVLEINADDPHAAGIAHGYLVGAVLSKIFNKLKEDGTIPKRFPAQALQLSKKMLSVIPKDQLLELQGIVEGYNRWSKQNPKLKPHKLTIDLLLFLHLIPDGLHFNIGNAIKGNVGCTVVVEKDPEKGMIVGRNLDWDSHGIFGTHSLIIKRTYTDNQRNTLNVAIPGLAGTLTGMNASGVFVAMNVCQGKTEKINGMPAVFFNQFCLNNAKSVKEVKKIVAGKSPLGSYHMTVADGSKAKSFHFFQGGSQTPHITRKKINDEPLIVTNCRYTSENKCTQHMFWSEEREKKIRKLFKKRQADSKSVLIEDTLKLDPVNNHLTLHSVIARPGPGKKEIRVAFANSNAGSVHLSPVDW